MIKITKIKEIALSYDITLTNILIFSILDHFAPLNTLKSGENPTYKKCPCGNCGLYEQCNNEAEHGVISMLLFENVHMLKAMHIIVNFVTPEYQ